MEVLSAIMVGLNFLNQNRTYPQWSCMNKLTPFDLYNMKKCHTYHIYSLFWCLIWTWYAWPVSVLFYFFFALRCCTWSANWKTSLMSRCIGVPYKVAGECGWLKLQFLNLALLAVETGYTILCTDLAQEVEPDKSMSIVSLLMETILGITWPRVSPDCLWNIDDIENMTRCLAQRIPWSIRWPL